MDINSILKGLEEVIKETNEIVDILDIFHGEEYEKDSKAVDKMSIAQRRKS